MLINYDSSANQRIKDKFVNREVEACISMMAEYILKQEDSDAPFCWEDVENYSMPKCSECGSSYGFEETECDTENENGELIPIEGYKCKGCDWFYSIDEYNDLDTEPQDIFEWWIVSNWFGEKLRDKGEPVIEQWGFYIWGRTCTGQSISMDYVIGEICEDMGILEGQENDWSDN